VADRRLVIFDWDGTLVDSVGLIVSSMQKAALVRGIPEADDHAVRRIIGLELGEAIGVLYPMLGQRDRESVRKAYVDAYLAMDMASHKFFPGIDTLLDNLAADGCRLAIATGKSRRGLDRAISAMGVAERFAASLCADETRGKPDPAMVLELCALAGVDASKTPVVGDTLHDMEMARRAGSPAIAVSWGAHSLDEMLAAYSVQGVEDVEQLSSVLVRRG
jgi:phosphoglycolate phosphatase